MLILKSLTFANIGRFVEEQTIDFTKLGSLVQVDGQNNNTGGSSGSGKSTVFKALEFLLGLNDISNGVLQSRLTKEPLSVTGLFELDGVPLKIKRDKKFLIDLNGEVTTGSSKLTEEKLDQIIGMPRDLFRKILHKRQGEGGFFLDMGPSEVHKFLTSCLGLEKEQNKISILDNRLESLEKDEKELKFHAMSAQSGLEATQSAITSLGPSPTLEANVDDLGTFKMKYLGAKDIHMLVLDGHRKEMGTLEAARPKIRTESFDRTRIEQLESEIGTILDQITTLEDNEKQRCNEIKSQIHNLQIEKNNLINSEEIRQARVRSDSVLNSLTYLRAAAESVEGGKAKVAAVRLAEELKKIRSSICPTCEQGWANDATKAKEADILNSLQELKKLVIIGISADKELLSVEEQKKKIEFDLKPIPIPGLSDLESKIAQITLASQLQAVPEAIELKLKVDFKNKELLTIRQEERDHQFKETAKSQDILAIYAQKQTELRKSHELALSHVREEERKAYEAYEGIRFKIRSFEENKKRHEESFSKLHTQLLKYNDQFVTKQSELSLILEEIELAQESKKAIKSYLSCSFEDALESIGDVATRLIRAIPNMSTATIQFEGLKETKEGKIKEEVTCTISMDGEIGIPVKSLSGGERSSTDLAIDLSVIKFIEERTGKGIDLMILDEPFTGLDTTNVFEALEMLKESSVDKRLLIVDHNPIAAQSIESRLTVVRDGLTSKIMQQ